MTYAVHYQAGATWLVRDFASQPDAQSFARAVGGRVNAIVNLHQQTIASLIAGGR